ncbi:hypothetical protein M9458_031249, partial [Cirrhinus mrigala]
ETGRVSGRPDEDREESEILAECGRGGRKTSGDEEDEGRAGRLEHVHTRQ